MVCCQRKHSSVERSFFFQAVRGSSNMLLWQIHVPSLKLTAFCPSKSVLGKGCVSFRGSAFQGRLLKVLGSIYCICFTAKLKNASCKLLAFSHIVSAESVIIGQNKLHLYMSLNSGFTPLLLWRISSSLEKGSSSTTCLYSLANIFCNSSKIKSMSIFPHKPLGVNSSKNVWSHHKKLLSWTH